MSRSRAAASVVGSPVLLGAITVLVVIVAVFLAYNANRGLPFVPTYNVRVETPTAANLVEGNEVRLAGYRVGAIENIRPARTRNLTSVALLDLKLDKTVEPLPVDTQVVVRPRSLLGLKYLDLRPGTSTKKLEAGATLPLQNSETAVEFDDLLNTFDAQTRRDQQTNLAGFGNAFAGRGQSLNIALAELPELFRHLTPVMDTLNDEDTEIDEFFKNIGEAAAEAAPVARTQAILFTHMADTFEAFSARPPALQETISRQPPLYRAGIDKFPFQQVFLANFTDLSNKLRPGARELDRRLPVINTAIVEGKKTNRILPIYNRELRRVLAAVDHLTEDPNTLLALKDLTVTNRVLERLLEFIAPYNTVCNHATYWFVSLGEHISEEGNDGTAQRVLIKFGNLTQDDRANDTGHADRPVDVSRDEDPHTARDPEGNPLQALRAQPYNPAIDRSGRADCQAGQWGYPHGPLVTGGRYPPRSGWNEEGQTEQPSGGSRVVADARTPGRAGPTFTGVPSLRAVDRNLRR
jgi:virulence factor Mce-like protein